MKDMQQVNQQTTFASFNPKSGAKEDVIDDDVLILNTRPRQQEPEQQQQSSASLIPLTFLSTRQSKALWAPHCCSKSRAQILSDYRWRYWRTMTTDQVMDNNHTTSNNKEISSS